MGLALDTSSSPPYSAIALDTAQALQTLRSFALAPRDHASLGDLAWAVGQARQSRARPREAGSTY